MTMEYFYWNSHRKGEKASLKDKVTFGPFSLLASQLLSFKVSRVDAQDNRCHYCPSCQPFAKMMITASAESVSRVYIKTEMGSHQLTGSLMFLSSELRLVLTKRHGDGRVLHGGFWVSKHHVHLHGILGKIHTYF